MVDISVFADTARLDQIKLLAGTRRVAGFTTNPTLFRAAGATDYLEHARAVIEAAAGKPVSLEVIADDLVEMGRQARILDALAPWIYVKIPVTTTDGASTCALISDLRSDGISLNITAVFTEAQVRELVECFRHYPRVPVIVSIFAGRIADAGCDAYQLVRDCCRMLAMGTGGMVQVLWASPRQVYDLLLADRAGCAIITMTPELIDKIRLINKDLTIFSRETVEMFYRDAQAAGYVL